MHPLFHFRAAALSLALWALYNLGTTTPPAAPAQSVAASKPSIVRDIPYTKTTAKTVDRRQTLDLYLPPKSAVKPPLVVFVHGGFWLLSDDNYRIGPDVTDALVPSGVAVALVRYRLAPTHRHPTQAQDVAAAVAHLAREANKYGYDGRRIVLAGHSAGAHLAALVALDPAYLGAHRLSSQSLAGVIALSGIYNLHPTAASSDQQRAAVQQTFGENPDILKAASPTTHIRAAAPPFLILAAESDFPGFPLEARKFANALRAAGHSRVEQYLIPDRNHFSLTQLAGVDNPVRELILEFLKVAPLPEPRAWFFGTKRSWPNLPFSTLPFWRDEKLLRSFPVDQRLVAKLLPVYTTMRYELLDLPLESYAAIDLLSYLDSVPQEKIGGGNYLTITNLRNEKIFWDRRRIEPYKPVIVIGIDDERNLFRLGVFYRGLREYSWKESPPPPMMARPLGAFIHFLEPAPPEFGPQASHYALTENSFQLTEKDPLEPLRHLPKELYEALTFRNGCVYCHTLGGVGSQSHHVTIPHGSPHGGLALPLESYPPEVWKAFIFSQDEVAANLGASPNIVDEEARQGLYDLVVESRERMQAPAR